MSYKRTQIEEALSRLFDPKSKAVRAELRTRIGAFSSLIAPNKPNMHFSATKPLGPAPIFSFSEYDAFAQINGTWVATKVLKGLKISKTVSAATRSLGRTMGAAQPTDQ